MHMVGDTTIKSTISTSVRGLLPRTLLITGIVTFTAACSGTDPIAPATGRLAPAPGTATALDTPTTSLTGAPSGAGAASSAPSANPAPGSALLNRPQVGANPSAEVPSLILATGSGQTTGSPEPPPNTVSLEDLYRQGQVDISR